MILEHAILNIRKGKSREFEAALEKARPLIEATQGFQRMEVRPCVETADRYVLLVWWSSLEAHTVGFRHLHHIRDLVRTGEEDEIGLARRDRSDGGAQRFAIFR